MFPTRWCGFGLRITPALNALHHKHRDQDNNRSEQKKKLNHGASTALGDGSFTKAVRCRTEFPSKSRSISSIPKMRSLTASYGSSDKRSKSARHSRVR